MDPSSTPRSCLYIANWSASRQLPPASPKLIFFKKGFLFSEEGRFAVSRVSEHGKVKNVCIHSYITLLSCP